MWKVQRDWSFEEKGSEKAESSTQNMMEMENLVVAEEETLWFSYALSSP
jgi:hypothetical protein